jgi:hypothetical protein
MSTNKNKHGLTRDIPLAVKREVRQRSRFGCVVCGLFLYDYEHFDPPFEDAEEHSPDGICLLCPNHHRRSSRPALPKAEIAKAYRNPKALSRGYAHDADFAALRRPLMVRLGHVVFIDPRAMIMFENEEILAINDDEDSGQPVLTGRCYNSDGRVILDIVRSEWRGPIENWDVEQQGSSLIIRHGLRDIALAVEVVSQNELRFTHVHMNIRGGVLVSRPGQSARIEGVPPHGGCIEIPHIATRGPVVYDQKGNLRIEGGSALW